MKTKPIDRKRSECLDDRLLVRIAASRAKEIGVPVDIASLTSRLPDLAKAQRFAWL